jgi:acetylornithine deacetylase/succinyl-diaminopimelate desuccinylase-like protein
VRLDPVVRLYFERLAALETGAVAADLRTLAQAAPGAPLDSGAVARLSAVPPLNARMHTTCTPTRLEGGHADNALPQLAAALVNCRLLPGDTLEGTRAALAAVIADDRVVLTPVGSFDAGPVGLPPPELMTAIERVTARQFPGIPVLPIMMSGATDGRFLRKAGVPTYGVAGPFNDVDDVRAHGRDERILIQAS